MEWIVGYDRWRAFFESTGQLELNVKDIESKILSRLPKGVTLDTLKANLSGIGGFTMSDQPFTEVTESRLMESIDIEYWVDTAIDLVSGLFESLPGLGNLASSAVDILHTISYAMRAWFAKEEGSKVKYLAMCALGAIGSFMPLAGNMLNLAGLKKIDSFLSVSPKIIYSALSKLKGGKLPITHWSQFAKWKIKLIYVLSRVLGQVGHEVINGLVSSINSSLSKVVPTLKRWVSSSPLTGWIVEDWVLPSLTGLANIFQTLSAVI
jgi:hypothetical protein